MVYIFVRYGCGTFQPIRQCRCGRVLPTWHESFHHVLAASTYTLDEVIGPADQEVYLYLMLMLMWVALTCFIEWKLRVSLIWNGIQLGIMWVPCLLKLMLMVTWGFIFLKVWERDHKFMVGLNGTYYVSFYNTSKFMLC